MSAIKITLEFDTYEEATEFLMQQQMGFDASLSPQSQPSSNGSTTTRSAGATPVSPSDETVTGSPPADSAVGTKEKSPKTTKTPSKILISDAVQKYADENGIDVSELEGSGKQGRIIKSDVAKAIQDKVDAEEEKEFGEDDDDFGLGLDDDDEEEAPAAPLTLDDVREALKTFQIAAKNKLLAKGKDEAEAKSKAIGAARKLLKDTAGTDKLGAVEESKFADVVDTATKSAAKLQ